MYADESKQAVLRRLDKEPIRYIDGRYSDGFVEVGMLTEMIQADHTAELYNDHGMRFVRRVKPPKNYHGQ